jgi:hypothetical protein
VIKWNFSHAEQLNKDYSGEKNIKIVDLKPSLMKLRYCFTCGSVHDFRFFTRTYFVSFGTQCESM